MLKRLHDPDRLVPLALLTASAAALAAAFAGEHLFGLQPCILCLYERVPYAVVLVLAGLALFLPVDRRHRAFMVAACGIVFAAAAGLAVYHVGVEQHWWSAIAGCAGALPETMTIESLKAEISAPSPRKPCDEVDWRLFGISLAGYNAIASAVLAAASFAGARLLFSEQRRSRRSAF
ncbi:MAG: disulfide bond formation protein B [Rhodospirillales bacterium]|nr:disulfide bond formation protein B [Rhodospirillales bacterium]